MLPQQCFDQEMAVVCWESRYYLPKAVYDTMIYNIDWFTIHNDLQNTMIYNTQWFTIQIDLQCTMIYKTQWYTIHIDLQNTMKLYQLTLR